MINYIIQVMLFQTLFLAVYDLFLRKETFFQTNRFYLIATPIISFLLPFVKIPTFQKTIVANETIIFLPEIILSPQSAIEKTSWYASINYFEAIFLVGLFVFFIIFLIKLFKVIRLITLNKVEKKEAFNLIYLPNKTKAFSFFNYIFLGKEIPKVQQEKIIEHEVVHSKQKHSADLLFFESLKIVMWFNPLLYFYQQRIAIIHEYIADEFATKNSTKETYINTLLSEVFAVENISFINQFYKKSFLKKRIIMMTKGKSKKIRNFKYLLLIPVLLSMLFYSACSDNFTDKKDVSEKELQTQYRSSNGKLISYKGSNYTYLDYFIGDKSPKEIIEITFEDLSKKEQEEFYENTENIRNYLDKNPAYKNLYKFYFFKMPNGRNSYGQIIDGLNYIDPEDVGDEISVLKMEKTPTFPGCSEKDLDCFFKKLQEHFNASFNKEVLKNLGLSSGKKKVLTTFNIDTNGNAVDIEAEASDEVIKEEVIRVIKSLPKMNSGEKYGKPIKAKYTLPFTFTVE